MIRRGELTDRKITVANPTVRVVVVAPFAYGGRTRKVGEQLSITPTEAELFGREGCVRRVLGLRRP